MENSGMASFPSVKNPNRPIPMSRIAWVGALAIVAAVVANLLTRAVVLAVMDLPTGFDPLEVGPIAILTAIGVLGAVIVFAIVTRVARRPIRTFSIVGMAALVISCIPNVLLALDPTAAPMPGGTTSAFLVLILFHVVAAFVAILILTRLAPVD